jgi:Tol biopolymer transport system component
MLRDRKSRRRNLVQKALPLRTASIFAALAMLVMTLAAPHGTSAKPHLIDLVSVSTEGVLGNGDSGRSLPNISANGRYIAFQSSASNLVADDTNHSDDVFLRDSLTGRTKRLSVDTLGIEGNGRSGFASTSADGRYIAFVSLASNLVPGDTNAVDDIFVSDSRKDTVERVSVGEGGRQANRRSFTPAISADGRYVAFYSEASNLVERDTNHTGDVFVRDRTTGTTERVSVNSDENQGNGDCYSYIAISPNGRHVTFGSRATNLVAGDTNGMPDAFLHDRWTHTTERVSVGNGGNQGNSYTTSAPAISADGRYVAFASMSSNLVEGDLNGWKSDVFVRDRRTGTTERVSVDSAGHEGNDISGLPRISADGRYVAFASYASNLADEDSNGFPDIFLFDRETRTTRRINAGDAGNQANAPSFGPAISADGRYVAFGSEASNLISSDTNGFADVFIRDVRQPLD